jgi:hypothetical protein
MQLVCQRSPALVCLWYIQPDANPPPFILHMYPLDTTYVSKNLEENAPSSGSQKNPIEYICKDPNKDAHA